MGKGKNRKRKSVETIERTITIEAGIPSNVLDTLISESSSVVVAENKAETMDAEMEFSKLNISFNHYGTSFKFCVSINVLKVNVSVKSAEITKPVLASKSITIITVQEVKVCENIEGKPPEYNATIDASEINFLFGNRFDSSKVSAKVNISKLKAWVKAEDVNSTSRDQRSTRRERSENSSGSEGIITKRNLPEIVTDIDDFEVDDRVNSKEDVVMESKPPAHTEDSGTNDLLAKDSSELEKCNLVHDCEFNDSAIGISDKEVIIEELLENIDNSLFGWCRWFFAVFVLIVLIWINPFSYLFKIGTLILYFIEIVL